MRRTGVLAKLQRVGGNPCLGCAEQPCRSEKMAASANIRLVKLQHALLGNSAKASELKPKLEEAEKRVRESQKQLLRCKMAKAKSARDTEAYDRMRERALANAERQPGQDRPPKPKIILKPYIIPKPDIQLWIPGFWYDRSLTRAWDLWLRIVRFRIERKKTAKDGVTYLLLLLHEATVMLRAVRQWRTNAYAPGPLSTPAKCNCHLHCLRMKGQRGKHKSEFGMLPTVADWTQVRNTRMQTKWEPAMSSIYFITMNRGLQRNATESGFSSGLQHSSSRPMPGPWSPYRDAHSLNCVYHV